MLLVHRESSLAGSDGPSCLLKRPPALQAANLWGFRESQVWIPDFMDEISNFMDEISNFMEEIPNFMDNFNIF